MEISFKDILDDPRFMEILEGMNSALSLNCHAWDTLGKPAIPTLWGNMLCKAIKSTNEGLLTCAATHKEMTREAKQTGKPVINECHAGLVKVVIPVHAGGKYIGLLGGCGRIKKGKSVDESYLDGLGPKINVPKETLLETAATVPEVELHRVEAKVAELVEYVASKMD